MRRKLPVTSALASFVLAMPAAADVIYSNLLNTEIPLDFTGVTINVGSGTLNPFFGGVAVANNAALQPFRTGTGGLDTILNFSYGSTIDAGSLLHLSTGDGGSQDHLGTTFSTGQEGYIGFKLNNTNYGWARVVFTNNTGGAVFKDWAYDNSGAGITVGGIRQVGQNITLSSASTFSSAFANSGGTTNLLKNSVGTSTLNAANTYTGTTTVSAGTLAVGSSGSINTSSGVTIDGGTFRYNASTDLSPAVTFTSGTVAGTNWNGSLGGLSVGTNQIIAPGNSTGTANTTSETWAGGGTYLWEINDATGSAGSETAGWDLLLGSGSLSITATASSKFNIDISSLGLNQLEGNAVNFNNQINYNWLIADFSTVISDFAAEAFDIDTTNFSNEIAGIFGIARGDNVGGDSSQIFLTYTFTPIPEPSSILLVALGSLALLRRHRS